MLYGIQCEWLAILQKNGLIKVVYSNTSPGFISFLTLETWLQRHLFIQYCAGFWPHEHTKRSMGHAIRTICISVIQQPLQSATCISIALACQMFFVSGWQSLQEQLQNVYTCWWVHIHPQLFSSYNKCPQRHPVFIFLRHWQPSGF